MDLMLCVQNVCVELNNINISKSNFGRICYDVGITSSKFVTNKRKMNEGLIILILYNLPLPKVGLTWQMMRRRVCGVSSGSTILYMFLFRMHMRTLSLRLDAPLLIVYAQSFSAHTDVSNGVRCVILGLSLYL